MSLINQMLRDLDERRASEREKDGISRHVRSLPPARIYPWKGLWLTIGGAIGGAIIVWLVLNWWREPILPPRTQAAAPPAAQASPVATGRSSQPIAEPSPVPTTPEPARPWREVQRPIVRDDGREPSLKLDRSLDIAPSAGAVPGPAPGPSQEDSGASGASPIRIEKQPRTPAVSEAADTEYRKGMSSLRLGLTAEALASFRAVLQLDAHHAAARQALLSLLADQRQWDEALAVSLDGLNQDPKQTGWAMLAARLQFEKGDTAAAIETLAGHVKYADRNGDYLSFYALLLEKAKRYPESIERYRAALALKPAEGRWWYGLGLALEANQQADEAKDAYRQARDSANLPDDIAAAVDQKLKSK